MARPSDYRHDPFSDISTAISLTERHLIPSISPYEIRLNEVPVKNSPTTTVIKEFSITGGAISYGAVYAQLLRQHNFFLTTTLVQMVTLHGIPGCYNFQRQMRENK